MAVIAFVGLGRMGAPMAGHLARAGHRVRVYNRSPEKAEVWASEHAGLAAQTVAGAVTGADALITCVGNDQDVLGVVEEALMAHPGLPLVIDHTTTSAAVPRTLSARFGGATAILDAPVSGGEAGAKNGQLTIMCGGTPKAFAMAEPVMRAYAKKAALLGPSGAGQLTKMVNQICIAGLVQALSEGIAFAQAAGLDPAEAVDVIGQGAAQSWQMQNRALTMAEGKFDFGFAVEWMRKDLRICLEEARRNGAQLPVTALVDQFYAEVERMGGKRWDTSSLIARLRPEQT